MDELYIYGIVNPGMKLAGWFFKFDQRVIDGFVNLSGRGTIVFSNINRWIDNYIVDGLVNTFGFVTRTVGTGLRYIQTGFVQNYILVVFLGLVLLLLLGYKR
jgi:NADH:ubiquinone oxidoreductase subunit 5 (subunit L)/multisubunit Na+/H+ antiporter MnhA subunit